MLRSTKLIVVLLFVCLRVSAQTPSIGELFAHPPEAARPWVFWYWMQGAVSKEGIHADLAAMKQVGIGGAYLMPIQGAAKPPIYTPVVEQLSPLWWQMVRYAMEQADSLGLRLAMHYCDGFAIGGGPWITPALSMQKVVWTKTVLGEGALPETSSSAGGIGARFLPRPEAYENYYEDIAVLAYPEPIGWEASTRSVKPVVTTSTGADASFLAGASSKESFKSDTLCWIQYAFDRPFTCRTVRVTAPNNYQAQRLVVEASDDGIHFRQVTRLFVPRHGWEDGDEPVTHVLPTTTARYFRFVYDKQGGEPGSEDLDAAKWKPSLKLSGIELLAAPGIENIEGKNGGMWRLSTAMNSSLLPRSACVDRRKIVDVTSYMDSAGRLQWKAPPCEAGMHWVVLRIGHTSTGHMNATGGGGKGLECDKFSPGAIQLQWNRWYGEALRQAGPDLAKKVLKIFHVDSWECGSQNWSPVFRAEFKKRRGYDCYSWLPVMAGVPMVSADSSERFLYDVRTTIAELLHDVFYTELAGLAHQAGCQFSAESVAPTMMSDGMLHYDLADLPTGEYWLRSPTHDKPNDIADAVSGAHIYGKNIVQAEAFTQLKEAWDEYPGMLKTTQDRNYALGINRLIFHVFTHNPWVDKKPGMTLGGVGTYLQRDQIWWPYANAWIDYARRCQALLQWGYPVVDIAVFTGEGLPRRAVLPERLVDILPGLIGKARVDRERMRLANVGEPVSRQPNGVSHSANMADPAAEVNWLEGYAFDSFNPDALMRLSQVRNGRVIFPGGSSYSLLVLLPEGPMTPDAGRISAGVAARFLELVREGATLLVDTSVHYTAPAFRTLLGGPFDRSGIAHVGKGRVIAGPLRRKEVMGVDADLVSDRPAKIAWTHRVDKGEDIYFVSNQEDSTIRVRFSLRARGDWPEIFDPVTGKTQGAQWNLNSGRTEVRLEMAAGQSYFVVFRKLDARPTVVSWLGGAYKELKGPWDVQMGERRLRFDSLQDWSSSMDTLVRYFSGVAVYNKMFTASDSGYARIDLGAVADIARVYVNGVEAGTLWTPPFVLSAPVHAGMNELRVEVANTWINRLTGDARLDAAQRSTFTVVPFAGSGHLPSSGLLGPVRISEGGIRN